MSPIASVRPIVVMGVTLRSGGGFIKWGCRRIFFG